MTGQVCLGYAGHDVKYAAEAEGPRVFDVPARAPDRVGLAGRREPPEVGPEDLQLFRRHIFQVQLPDIVAREVQAVDVQRRGALVYGACHADMGPRRGGCKPADPAKKFQGTYCHSLTQGHRV